MESTTPFPPAPHPACRAPQVARLLDRITPQLRGRLRLSKLLAIRHARIPILKLTTHSGVSVDVSIASDSGPRAAAFIRQQVRARVRVRVGQMSR